MAFKGKIISNPFNKQTIEFVSTARDSSGALLEMISTWQPGSIKPAPHYHPNQDEYFTVTEGKLTVLINEKEMLFTKGDAFIIPRNTVHAMWNDGHEPTTVRWKVIPALNTEYLLEIGAGLAGDNKVGRNGTPGVLYSSLLLKRYKREFRIIKPSYTVQKMIFAFLRPLALLKGRSRDLTKYLD